MKIVEMQVRKFLKEDLGVNPKYRAFDTLKDMLLKLDENIENKNRIISFNGERIKNTVHLSYFIKGNHHTDKFLRIVGTNGVVTAKTFVMACYEYYNERYN